MWERMLNAIQLSDPILLGHFLNLEPDLVYDQNSQKKTLLHFAAISSNAATIFELLKKGARADAQDAAGWSPLHVACKHNNEEAVILFIESGIKLNIVSKANETPLHIATKNKHSSIAARLLAAGASANVQNNRGNTPLHIAASSGFIDSLIILMLGKANVNSTNIDGQSPLHLSALNQKLECSELLLKNNANPNLPDKQNCDFFDYSGISGKILNFKIQRLRGKKDANLCKDCNFGNLKLETFFNCQYHPEIRPSWQNILKNFVHGLLWGHVMTCHWRTTKLFETLLWFLVYPLLLYGLYHAFQNGIISPLISFDSRALYDSLGLTTQHLVNTILVFLCSSALITTEKNKISYLYFFKDLRDSIHFRVLHFALIELTFFNKLVFNSLFFQQFIIFWFLFIFLYSLSYLLWWEKIFLRNQKYFDQQLNDYIINA